MAYSQYILAAPHHFPKLMMALNNSSWMNVLSPLPTLLSLPSCRWQPNLWPLSSGTITMEEVAHQHRGANNNVARRGNNNAALLSAAIGGIPQPLTRLPLTLSSQEVEYFCHLLLHPNQVMRAPLPHVNAIPRINHQPLIIHQGGVQWVRVYPP